MAQAMSIATCPWKFVAPQQHTSFLFSLFHCLLRPSALVSHGPSNVHCNLLWKFVAALNSTPLSCFPFFFVFFVLLLLRRMAQAMSIATCLWKFVAALNSTPLSCFAFAASITFQDHPLLRCSQQMLSNTKVDTTPLVAHIAGPINCHFFSMARFTIKIIPESYSRTSATRWIVDKNHIFYFVREVGRRRAQRYSVIFSLAYN
jgi:hypothetical protein